MTMTATAAPPESRTLLSRLARTRARARLVGIGRAVGLLVLLTAGVAFASFVIDREWEPDVPSRVPFVLFCIGVELVGLVALLRAVFRRDLSDDEVARWIEQANPDLDEAFISSVQLARELESNEVWQSPELIASVITRAETKTRSLSTPAEARFLPVVPIVAVAAVVLGLGVSAFQRPETQEYAKAWQDRVLLMQPDVEYPKPVSFEVEIPEEHRDPKDPQIVHVVRGEDLTIGARVTRGGTDGMKVLTRFAVSRRSETKSMARIADDSWTKSWQNVTEPFSFMVDAGYQVRSKVYEVKLVDRARIEEAKFWLEFPAYTSLPKTPEKEPVTRTSLEVPVGTKIRYLVKSTRSVETAKLIRFFDPKNAKPEDGPAPTVGGSGELAGRVITGEFTVMQDQRFRFELVSEGGVFGDRNGLLYQVRAIKDQPPDLVFRRPGRSKEATKTAIVPMELSVKDQYGVDRLELVLTFKRNGKETKTERREITEPFAAREGDNRKGLWRWKLSMADLDLLEGDELAYRAVGYDRNVDESRRAGYSLVYTLRIVSNDDLARILQDRLQRLKTDLESTAEAQKNARQEMEKANESLQLSKTLSRDDRRRLTRIESSQRNVTNRLKQVTKEFEKLLEEREINRLIDEREEVLQKDLKNQSKQLAEADSPAITREIRDAMARPEELDKPRLATIPDKQAEVERRLRSLINKLDNKGNFGDLLRALQGIQKDEEKVLKGVDERLKDQAK